KLSRELTELFYSAFRRPIGRAQLFHVEAPANLLPDTSQEEAAIKGFFGGLGPVMKPLLFEAEARPTPGDMAAKLQRFRDIKTLLQKANLLETREALKATDARLLEALQQHVLFQAGLFENESDPEAALAQVTNEWHRLSLELEPLEAVAKERLMILL